VTEVIYILLAYAVIMLWRRHTLIGLCYRYVRKLVQGDEDAAYGTFQTLQREGRSRTKRGTGGAATPDLYQPSLIKPARAADYVTLIPRPQFFVWPTRRNLRGVTVHAAPEVPFDGDFLAKVTKQIATFLGITPEEVEQDASVRRLRVTVTRLAGHATSDQSTYATLLAELPQAERMPQVPQAEQPTRVDRDGRAARRFRQVS
jgi:hypothetical protein